MICHSMSWYFEHSILNLMFLVIFVILVYICIRHAKSMASEDEKNTWVILFCVTVLFFFIFGLILLSMNYLFKGFTFTTGNDRTSAATLTTGTVTAFSLLTALAGVLYSSSQNRIQNIHSESSWRKIALELEQKKHYTIGDLINLNSLFNAYKGKPKDPHLPVDFYINKVIVRILRHHNINQIKLNEFSEMREQIISSIPQKELKKIQRKKTLIPYMYKNSLTDSFKNEAENNSQDDNLTLFNYDINSNNINISLNSEENQVIRKCIHALLKNDWDNVTK